jgi:hypothetical protein
MKKIKLLNYNVILFAVYSILLPPLSYASQTSDAGIIAENAFVGVMTIKSIITNICLVLGAFLILSSFFQYKKYRRNPSEMPIGRPVTTLIVGLILIAVTFIPIQFME